jgi:hypothetical protein
MLPAGALGGKRFGGQPRVDSFVAHPSIIDPLSFLPLFQHTCRWSEFAAVLLGLLLLSRGSFESPQTDPLPQLEIAHTLRN